MRRVSPNDSASSSSELSTWPPHLCLSLEGAMRVKARPRRSVEVVSVGGAIAAPGH